MEQVAPDAHGVGAPVISKHITLNYKNKILTFLLLMLLSSCQPSEDEDRFVVVEKYNEKYLEDTLKYAPYDYYVGNNIIVLEESEEIFYHNTSLMCGTGWSVSNPPTPIDFKANPLLQFNSVEDFFKFIRNYTPSQRSVIFASDADTIRNDNYFQILDSLRQLDNTFVVARRRITPDELEATVNFVPLEIDMQETCNVDELISLQSELTGNQNSKTQLDDFFDLSRRNCQYYFDYEILYEDLLFQFIIDYPIEFLDKWKTIDEKTKRNIHLAISNSQLVSDSIVIQAYNAAIEINNNSQELLLQSLSKRMNTIIK